MLSINTNLSSLIAQSSLKNSTNILNQAVERMTTGYKINHAKDNAANYAISTNMTTQMSALQVAEDNAMQGLDMLNSASLTLEEILDMATRLRALSTQARNRTFGTQSLSALQEEANAIYNEINRLYCTAKYNGISLFDKTKYDIPENMPKADPITGFIENPYVYSDEYVSSLTAVSEVNDTFTENEYKIESVDDLVKLAELTNAGISTLGKTFILSKDLDLKDYCLFHAATGGWIPIGTEANPFKGKFNGNGHIVSNLTINRPTDDSQGLFGFSTGASIANIGLENANIIGRDRTGILAGVQAYPIINCYTTGYVKGSYYVGGIAGASDEVKNCYSMCDIRGSGSTGGLIGEIQNSISNSFFVGDIYAKYNGCGLLGQIYNPGISVNVKNCYSIANITGEQLLYSFTKILNPENLSVENCFFNSQEIDIFNSNSTTFTEALSQSIMSGIILLEPENYITSFLIGIKGESNSQLSINTNFEYNLGKIKRNGIESDAALKVIDEFVNLLSKKQTEYGALQNRLESALDEISTQYENLASSLSTIRDTDLAKESASYIQQQILQQAAATLMSTANQSPAIALQLI